MTRRQFLGVATAAGLALQTGWGAQAMVEPMATLPFRGVNLGGWLVLEKWMMPSLFHGIKGGDEYSVCLELGPKASDWLRKHQDTWITEKDFAWLAAHGINTVRLPIGYWALAGDGPFVPCAEWLDRAFVWAKTHQLGIWLDLHGAPGSQNGWDHSGRSGELNWPKPENVAHTLTVIEALAQRYGQNESLAGLELLNEPRWDVPLDVLKGYYQDGYRRVRPHLRPSVPVVIHDSFRPTQWADFMTGPEYPNVILDTHLYQCYTDDDRKKDAAAHIAQAATGTVSHLAEMSKQGLPIVVGEWSAALDGASLSGLSGFRLDTAKRGYGAAQLLAYEGTRGWFFWSYKTETAPEWSFRDCVERGWLPAHFG